jgi:hypothetical protein
LTHAPAMWWYVLLRKHTLFFAHGVKWQTMTLHFSKCVILDKWLLRKWDGEYSSFVLMIESSDSIWLDMAPQSSGSVPSGADHGFALGWNETEWIIIS